MKRVEENNFIIELEEYVRKGIPLLLDEVLSTPIQILEACVGGNEYHYMRDYISDDKGYVLELHFNKVSY